MQGLKENKNLLFTGFNIGDEQMQDILTSEYDIADTHDRKFVDTVKISDYEVLTDGGYKDIHAIGKTIPYDVWVLNTTNYELKCADKHLVFDENYFTKYVCELNIGDKIQTETGLEEVISVINTKESKHMYDLELDHTTDRRYYTNGILSHNSMWLQNISAKLADSGYNVVYVTLEMSAPKTTKRLGAMRLKIDINQYDEMAKDTIFMKNKINELKNLTPSNSLFDNAKPGRIFVKKYPTSDCTVTDLENYIKKFNQSAGVKMDVLVIDYINLMSIEKGYDVTNMLYLKGKHLSEGLRRLADKYELAIITATQTDKSVWGASDINLDDIPESKAIAEAADSVWGIIRNSEMKKNNLYRLKILKLRDGENHAQQIKFDFNTKYLSIENDVLLS